MKKKDNFINKVADFINKVADCIFNILTNKWVLLIVTIFVFILSLILFFDLENNKFVKYFSFIGDKVTLSKCYDFWGAYGDFFGGVLGALFALISVLYVAKTFREQQKETKAQRFNTIFSELLALYQSEVKNLELLSEEKNTIKNRFSSESSSFSEIRKYAYNRYMDFYVKNRGRIESYFRVLFRIFEFIDKSDLIDDSQRKEYAKIIRAQLKGDELFLLRYNALCIEGEDFIEYLNKYRVLKHLAVSEMLEFKIFWEKMSDEDKASMNMTYCDIYNTLKEVIEDCKDKEYCRIKSDKYKFLVQFIKKSEIHISLIICKGQNNQYKNFNYIDNMKEEKRKEMLKYFAEEIFVYSNYEKYNKQKLDIECEDLQDQTGILCKINNKEGKQLKIKYRQKKNCYFRRMYYRIISWINK